MKKYWLASDHHLGHEKILRFRDKHNNVIRPFANLDEMHEVLLKRHNEVISENDKVCFLGDFAFNHDVAEWFLKNSKGKKSLLILGNHDHIHDSKYYNIYNRYFEKIEIWRKRSDLNPKVILSHIPVSETILDETEDSFYNIHGHVHSNNLNDSRYYNVSVENTDYYPIELNTVLEKLKLANIKE